MKGIRLNKRQGNGKKVFMDYVQLHERAWGMEHYANRPSLMDILNAPVVVFWQVMEGEDEPQDNREIITLHDTLDAIEKILLQTLLRAQVKTPRRRITRLYKDKQRHIPRRISIEFDPVDDE